eukprot:10110287-Alexandrium_andersonii.AAC.1
MPSPDFLAPTPRHVGKNPASNATKVFRGMGSQVASSTPPGSREGAARPLASAPRGNHVMGNSKVEACLPLAFGVIRLNLSFTPVPEHD